MKVSLAIVCTLAIGSAVAIAQESHLKAPSTWKLDVANSDFGGPAPKSGTMHVISDTKAKLAWRVTEINDKGQTHVMSYTGPEDGQLRPVQGTKDKASFTPDKKSHWELADGTTEEDTLVVAPDGKSLTIEGKAKHKDGTEHPYKIAYNLVK